MSHTITLSFELKGDGDHEATRKEIANHLKTTLSDDFGRDSHLLGGYEGPTAIYIKVKQGSTQKSKPKAGTSRRPGRKRQTPQAIVDRIVAERADKKTLQAIA